jgi:histidyl-tRNA synthetase
VIQLYDALLAGSASPSTARAELDRRRRLPARLPRAAAPWLDEHAAELDEATREQAARNPLRALDNIAAKPPRAGVLRRRPTIGDSLCDACREHFAEVRRYLDAFGVRYELVPTLVRGLDYYTRTTWEFVGPEGGSQSTLSRRRPLRRPRRGARRPHTPGVGFGAGIERLLLALEDAAGAEDEGSTSSSSAQTAPTAPPCSRRCRAARAGVAADADFAGRSVKGQHTQAGRLGAKEVVVVDGGTDSRGCELARTFRLRRGRLGAHRDSA